MCKGIEDFKISLIEDGKSPKTVESYIGDIKGFIEFLGSKGVEFNVSVKNFTYSNKILIYDKISPDSRNCLFI